MRQSMVVIERMPTAGGRIGFDAATKRCVDPIDAGIVDPARVVRVALEDAVSVAGVLPLTEATLTDIPQGTAKTTAATHRGQDLRVDGRKQHVRFTRLQRHPESLARTAATGGKAGIPAFPRKARSSTRQGCAAVLQSTWTAAVFLAAGAGDHHRIGACSVVVEDAGAAELQGGAGAVRAHVDDVRIRAVVDHVVDRRGVEKTLSGRPG